MNQQSLIAFHGDEAVKQKYLTRVRAHREADEIIKGKYWEMGKGCAIGCTIHSDDHKAYETELGIPEWLARVEDTLFEGMSDMRSKLWPEKFLLAIQPRMDLEKVRVPFLVVILESSLKSLQSVKFDAEKFPNVKKAVEQSEAAVVEMIRCHREGLDTESAVSAARNAVWSAVSAARGAESAACSAARSAEWSAASAMWSAASAESAESAASAACSAARSAMWSAESAESAACSAYEYFADELLRLISETGCEGLK